MVKRVEKSQAEWRAQMTDAEFDVMRQQGTERPFTGEYDGCKTPGTYNCRGCGQPLFESTAKYDSRSGWPSFFQPARDDAVITEDDNTLGMRRTEVTCSACDAHLGHVFPDGPQPTGLRFCMNSLSLRLEPEDG